MLVGFGVEPLTFTNPATEEPVVIWLVAAFIAIATPLLGYFSPFGRTRRNMVAELQQELIDMRSRVDRLKQEVDRVSDRLEDCEQERARLERENHRLYRQLDPNR